MSVTSAILRPASGLEDATMGQKLDCTKEKMGSGVKFSLAQAGVAGATTAAVAGIASHADIVNKAVDKFAGSGIGQKITKSNAFSTLKEGAGKLVSAAKKNPKAAGVIAAVAGIGIAASSILSFADARANGKIEGKHQERVDNTNHNKE